MTQLYDEEAAGEYLGGRSRPISKRTLQRWRITGAGPNFVKVGHAVRYRQQDLEDWIARQCRSRTSVNTSTNSATI
jgi:hypothetical protein